MLFEEFERIEFEIIEINFIYKNNRIAKYRYNCNSFKKKLKIKKF